MDWSLLLNVFFMSVTEFKVSVDEKHKWKLKKKKFLIFFQGCSINEASLNKFAKKCDPPLITRSRSVSTSYHHVVLQCSWKESLCRCFAVNLGQGKTVIWLPSHKQPQEWPSGRWLSAWHVQIIWRFTNKFKCEGERKCQQLWQPVEALTGATEWVHQANTVMQPLAVS